MAYVVARNTKLLGIPVREYLVDGSGSAFSGRKPLWTLRKGSATKYPSFSLAESRRTHSTKEYVETV